MCHFWFRYFERLVNSQCLINKGHQIYRQAFGSHATPLWILCSKEGNNQNLYSEWHEIIDWWYAHHNLRYPWQILHHCYNWPHHLTWSMPTISPPYRILEGGLAQGIARHCSPMRDRGRCDAVAESWRRYEPSILQTCGYTTLSIPQVWSSLVV